MLIGADALMDPSVSGAVGLPHVPGERGAAITVTVTSREPIYRW